MIIFVIEAMKDIQVFITATEIEESLMKSYRVVRKTRYEEHNGKKLAVYKCYKGSSKFTTNEMNLLIDEALRVAYDLGIEFEEEYL